jgi:hypothetical protein
VTPVRGDDEKQTAEGKRCACHDRSGSGKLELRDLCGDQPDPGEQHEQESDFGEARAGLMRETKDEAHAKDCCASLSPRLEADDVAPSADTTRGLSREVSFQSPEPRPDW